MPTVSIIVPIYNVEKYLPDCINSILAQKYRDFELILIDDGSTDSCPRICDENAEKDERIRVIHRINGGVSAARNSGLDVAKGIYIAFCDGDDYWKPDYLQQLVDIILIKNVDCIVSNYIEIDEFGQSIRKTSIPSKMNIITSLEDRYMYILQGILGGKYGWEVWTRLFRADIIQKQQIRFCTTCGNYAEDMGFVLEYSLYANKIYSTEYCGYCYINHVGSMMRNSKDMVKLSQVNEISAQFGSKYKEVYSGSDHGILYPILHFLIMNTEYRKIIGGELYSTMGKEINKIENKKWYRKQTKDIYKCKKYLSSYYGKRIAQQMLLFSHYCLHGNWKRFCIESAIAYRWMISKE